MKFDINSPNAIVNFAKKLKGETLRKICGEEIETHDYKGKGNFGQILEKFYFGYEPNSNSEPDFKEAGLELKTTPLKTLNKGAFRSKERLVLNIINYLEVHKERFEESSFLKKNAHLLLVFYLYEQEKDLLDYLIKLVDDWTYPEEDLKIIKKDWETITNKIKEGKAHELSEGDTFYLGACTKGGKGGNLRSQPFSALKAKQRAYSLKQGYVNHIIAILSGKTDGSYGKIIIQPKILDEIPSLEDIVISKFRPYYGKSLSEIIADFKPKLNKRAKNSLADLTKVMLGIELENKIEEFEKAEIIVRTIRIKEGGLPIENISFPPFKYKSLIKTNWDNSALKKKLEQKFFFVFYEYKGSELFLKKVKFWNMSYADIQETKAVWQSMIEKIKRGMIVREVTDKGIRRTYFPKKTEHRICHVRPHARNVMDTYPLPVKDKLTGWDTYTKHSFWLNASYVKNEIFLK
ncbi:MAG: Sau3AI family type II restriction endonuclease [Chitinophagales bacterium]